MPDLQLDEKQMSQLVNWPHSTPVCDPQGEKLGFLVSSEFFRKLAYAWAREEFTEEELAAARATPGGLTTAELLQQLESAAPSNPNEALSGSRVREPLAANSVLVGHAAN